MTLEDRVSNLETNVGAIVGALEQVTQALRGIAAKQDEHSAALQTIMTIQSEQTQLLIEHSRILAEHSDAIRSIITIQNEHTRILLEHSVDIQFIKDMLSGSSEPGSA